MRFNTFTSSVLLYAILGATYPQAVEAIKIEDAVQQDHELVQLEGEGEMPAHHSRHRKSHHHHLAQVDNESEGEGEMPSIHHGHKKKHHHLAQIGGESSI